MPVCEWRVVIGFAIAVYVSSTNLDLRAEPTVSPQYLGTLYAPYDPPVKVSTGLSVYTISSARDAYFRGPNIDSRPIPPCADWYRAMTKDSFVIDVRCLLQTEDGAIIYMEMQGTFQPSDAYWEECRKGKIVEGRHITARPRVSFLTDSERYRWLNAVSAFGLPVREKCSESDYFIEYEIHSDVVNRSADPH